MNSKHIQDQAGAWSVGLLIGLLAFLVVIPVNIIDPANIGWLGIHEDTRTYFLSWDFYRNSSWHFPISENPRYGMEIAGSIFMADSVPLLAIPLKLFHGVLPEIFQYHGIWLLICFGLQGVFGWKLAGLVSNRPWHKCAITTLFLFQLPFLSRAMGHLPLMGHFFILASLLICLKKRDDFNFVWPLLIAGAACTNAYFLLMVLGLWFSDCVRRGLAQHDHWKKIIVEAALMLSLALLFCWQVGYFSVGGGVSAPGNPYGIYRFNLLSPIDSDGWSFLLKDIPGGPGDYEGFTYLGLGFIFMIVAAGLSLLNLEGRISKKALPGNPYLIVVLLIFVMYAITNFIGVGSYTVVIPLPDALSKLTSVFRGAGRLVWPALYFGLVLTTFIICKNYNARGAALILTLAVVLQISDSSAGWAPLKAAVSRSQSGSWKLGLNDPFWQEAGKHYKSVRRLPAGNITPNWSAFSAYAAQHKMQTDFIYLARINEERLTQLNFRNQQRVEQGDYDPDTLYITSDRMLASIMKKFNFDQDMVASIDGYIVIAPRWKSLSQMHVNSLNPSNYMDRAAQGVQYNMNDLKAKDARGLLQGWDVVEPSTGGVWSNGHASILQFPLGEMNFNVVELIGAPLVTPSRPQLPVSVEVNDVAKHSMLLDGANPNIRIKLDTLEKEAIARDGKLKIALSFDQVLSPKALGINTDNRPISYFIRSVRVE